MGDLIYVQARPRKAADPEMEDMLYDRISFRRFCGFSLNEKIPDDTLYADSEEHLKGTQNSFLSSFLKI